MKKYSNAIFVVFLIIFAAGLWLFNSNITRVPLLSDDNFYFVNDNDFYNVDCKAIFNEVSFSSYGMDENFRFDGQTFYFILNVEEKNYHNIKYNKIAITYDEDNFLSNVSIKAYRQECNSGIFLNDFYLILRMIFGIMIIYLNC